MHSPEAARRQLRRAQQQADRLTAQAVEARQRASDTGSAAEELTARQAAAQLRIRQAREKWGTAFPEGWLALSQDQQELSAPWSDEEWTTARTQVFLAALDLHRAFVTGAAGPIRRNLRQLVGALGREPGAPGPEAELIAWQTLFLLVPVISTTFASCGRMFGALGAGSLGWVLVDEEGTRLGRPPGQPAQRRGQPGAPPVVHHRWPRGMGRGGELQRARPRAAPACLAAARSVTRPVMTPGI